MKMKIIKELKKEVKESVREIEFLLMVLKAIKGKDDGRKNKNKIL